MSRRLIQHVTNSRRRSRRSIAACGKAIGVGIMIVGYVAATFGYPLASSRKTRDGRPFPCQFHLCGCETADECWDHCCCYSVEQKLAWAAKFDVVPPIQRVTDIDSDDSDVPFDLAELHVDHIGQDIMGPDCDSPSHEVDDEVDGQSCCHSGSVEPDSMADGRLVQVTSIDDHDDGDERRQGHDSHHSLTDCGSCSSPSGASKFRFVLSSLARFCKSLPSLWVTTGAVILVIAEPKWQFDWSFSESLSLVAPRPECSRGAPPAPPPRHLVVA